MILFPNAKINIGLNIIEKRPDNYHNIESVFMPIPLCDVLEVVEAKETSLHLSGIPIDGDSNDNLIMKAYRLMQEQD
jgi:4-diphosphocytidyl-2-C-methyl-D-erythritol kinase